MVIHGELVKFNRRKLSGGNMPMYQNAKVLGVIQRQLRLDKTNTEFWDMCCT